MSSDLHSLDANKVIVYLPSTGVSNERRFPPTVEKWADLIFLCNMSSSDKTYSGK